MPRDLAVNDGPDIGDLLREFLMLQRFEVVTATKGREILHAPTAGRPQTVRLDILPRIIPLESLRKFRTQSMRRLRWSGLF